MKTTEHDIEESRDVENIHYMRLMALLQELVREKGYKGAARVLEIDPQTVTESAKTGRLTRRVRDSLERALQEGVGSAAERQRKRNEELEGRVEGVAGAVETLGKEVRRRLSAIEGAVAGPGRDDPQGTGAGHAGAGPQPEGSGEAQAGAARPGRKPPTKPSMRREYPDLATREPAPDDEVRRAFAKPGNEHLIALHWRRFLEGALGNGVSEETTRRIFAKVNGHYMFPESHSHAFAVTAYQAAWLKRHHPLEFFTALMNNQPMGFYPLETLKQDARRFGVPFRNPCVNRSRAVCAPEEGAVRLGLQLIRDVGEEAARCIVEEREERGPYAGAGDLVRRTGLKPQAVLSLVQAGAFDALTPNRRAALWDAGLSIRPSGSGQRAFPVSTEDSAPDLADFTAYERMVGEYRVMGVYPRGHLMEFVRPTLSPRVLPTAAVEEADEGEEVLLAGWPVARQHPRGKDGTVFVTIEDETGDVQLILWPHVFARHRRELGSRVLLVRGVVSRWDGTTIVIVSHVRPIDARVPMPAAHDWH